MSRLDAEYDPTEHHDLDRIDPHPIGGCRELSIAVCACGWESGGCVTTGAARREHDDHRDIELGIGCG